MRKRSRIEILLANFLPKSSCSGMKVLLSSAGEYTPNIWCITKQEEMYRTFVAVITWIVPVKPICMSCRWQLLNWIESWLKEHIYFSMQGNPIFFFLVLPGEGGLIELARAVSYGSMGSTS